jgi:large subunit ribosomal protein L10
MEGCVLPQGKTQPLSKTAGGQGPLKIGLRRWWDPNQDFPDEGRTEYDGVLKGWVGARVPTLCDASDRETKMALKLEEKKVVVAEVNAVAAKALSVVGAENRGLTVTQMTDLRAKARKDGVYVRIVKNTLARRAVAGTAFECISPALKGPIVLAFSNDDPGAAARIVKAFSKDNDKLVTTLVSLGGQLLKPQDLDRVASLPTRAQALSLLLGVLKAPISKFVGTLAAPNSKLVRTLAAVLEAKKTAAEKSGASA